MRDIKAIFGVDYKKHYPTVSKKSIKQLTRNIPKKGLTISQFAICDKEQK